MCTIAFLIDVVADAPLVVAANRDEMYARPTRPPEVLVRDPLIAGGVDELSGGTWLAVRADGRFVAVTNQRALAPAVASVRSRGLIVKDVAVSETPDAVVAGLDATQYASMNLVWGSAAGVSIAYARRDAGTVEVERLPRGVHVLCNDRLRAPGFPRGERLQANLEELVASGRSSWAAIAPRLKILMADRVTTEPTMHSHLPPEIERELTAVCIHTEAYGTRSSSIVAFGTHEVLSYLHADGPPDQAAYADRTELLR